MPDRTVHQLVNVQQSPLSPRQRLFCARIAGGASGAEAARQAGYSVATAAQQASRLLRQRQVQGEIERLAGDDSVAERAMLDRLLNKVQRVYDRALRDSRCSAALRAIEMEASLRSLGARTLPEGVTAAALEYDPVDSEPL